MRPTELLIRCLAEFDGQQWTAVSLEFDLAAQADTFDQVRQSLDAQIQAYLRDASVGEDRAHAEYLLKRRAPASAFLKYYLASVLSRFHGDTGQKPKGRKLFTETLRIQPA